VGKVRIGFIGVGSMGQMAHLRNYATIPECEVVAIADLREKTGKLVAERYGVPHVYRDYVEMLDTERLDGVAVIQHFSQHAAMLPNVYRRARNVLTEKPLAVSVSAGEGLVNAAREFGCRHMVAYHKRSDPATMHAKAIVDRWRTSNEMGSLRYIRMFVTMPVGDWGCSGFVGMLNGGDPKPPLNAEPPMTDLAADAHKQYLNIVNNYVHQINLMRFFLGESYHVTYAEKTGVLMAVESRTGVPGVIELEPYRTTREWEETVLIAFANGYVRLRLPTPMAVNRAGEVEVFTDPGGDETPRRTVPSLPWVDAMRQQAINFVRVCKGEMAPPCDAAEGLDDLKVVRQYVDLWTRR